MTKHYYPNSLVSRIAEAVRRRGQATLSDVAPDFPEYTRKQVHDALSNARDRRLLKTVSRGSGRARIESVWAPDERMGEKVGASPRVPSVWDLASPPAIVLSIGEGRRYSPLGAWQETEQEAA